MGEDLLLINQNFNADTLNHATVKLAVHDSVMTIRESFLHTGNRLFEAPHSFLSGHVVVEPGQYWIFYLLVGFIAFFAFIKYYFARDLNTLISSLGKSAVRADSDTGGKVGSVVTTFLFINFLLSIGMLVVAFNEKFHFFQVRQIPVFYFFMISALVALGYYLFNELSILVAGFLFGISKHAIWYAKTSSHLVYVLGIILLPLLLIYFFTGLDILLYLSVFMIVAFVLFKWFLLLRNSYSVNQFTIFHNILYLCALEIIPIMLLIRVSMGSIL